MGRAGGGRNVNKKSWNEDVPRRTELCEFEANLIYRASSRTAQATQKPCPKKEAVPADQLSPSFYCEKTRKLQAQRLSLR